MLEKLQLDNFQTHERLRIVFDPHVTTIVGRSDVGKSAIIRALAWLMTNRPSGAGFVRHRQGTAAVRLVIDGRKAQRIRGKDENSYVIDDKELKSFGTDVPEEIARLFNIADINFQGQLDPVFWLRDAPGQVSKNLNTIVDLDIIDITIGMLNTKLRKDNILLEEAVSREKTAKEELKRLQFVPAMMVVVNELKQLENTLAQKRHQQAALATLAASLQTQARAAQVATAAALAGKIAVTAGTVAQLARSNSDKLDSLLEDIKLADDKAWYLEQKAIRLKQELITKTGGICPICQSPMKL